MKFSVLDSVLDYSYHPVKTIDKSKKEIELTWREVIDTALNTPIPQEQLSAEEKSKCYKLSLKTYADDNPDFDIEERAFLIERIRKVFTSPLVCGRAEEYFHKEK